MPQPPLVLPARGRRERAGRGRRPQSWRRHLLLVTTVTVGLLAAVLRPAGATPPPTPTFGKAVDAFAKYDGQQLCDPAPKPGVVAFRELVLRAYPKTTDFGISRDCAVGGQSEHKEGRAWDWGVSSSDGPAAQEVLQWLLATDEHGNRDALLRRFGIMYVIYNKQVFESYRPQKGWQPYTGASPHTDHVHFSFSWDGALERTSWWTATPPRPTPAIDAQYRRLGGAASYLGKQVGVEYAVAGGRARHYQYGEIYWSAATGAKAVHGAIRDKYLAFGGPASVLGLPISDEYAVRNGRTSAFSGGQIYWSPTTGAQAVYGAIVGKYLAVGGPDGVLGLPTADEYAVRDGRASPFTGGQVYWSPTTGAQAVYGMIAIKYLAAGGPDGGLGLPVTDEYAVRNGRASAFVGGQIYWSPTTDAKAVYGAILSRYVSLGAAESGLGLPTTDEYDVPGGRRNSFQGGWIQWSAATVDTKVTLT